MTFLEQARSILKTMSRCVKDKTLLATVETVELRAAICSKCPLLKGSPGKQYCSKCGCTFKRKISIHGSYCPLGKW